MGSIVRLTGRPQDTVFTCSTVVPRSCCIDIKTILTVFQMECCGFNSPTDWQTSRYYTDVSTAAARGSTVVPRSCCIDINMENCNNAVDPLKVYNTVSEYRLQFY